MDKSIILSFLACGFFLLLLCIFVLKNSRNVSEDGDTRQKLEWAGVRFELSSIVIAIFLSFVIAVFPLVIDVVNKNKSDYKELEIQLDNEKKKNENYKSFLNTLHCPDLKVRISIGIPELNLNKTHKDYVLCLTDNMTGQSDKKTINKQGEVLLQDLSNKPDRQNNGYSISILKADSCGD